MTDPSSSKRQIVEGDNFKIMAGRINVSTYMLYVWIEAFVTNVDDIT